MSTGRVGQASQFKQARSWGRTGSQRQSGSQKATDAHKSNAQPESVEAGRPGLHVPVQVLDGPGSVPNILHE